MAVASPTKSTASNVDRSRLQRFLGRDFAVAWLFLLPLLVVLIGLIAYPFVSAIVLSFQRKMVGGDATFIGFGNYYTLLTNSTYNFFTSVRVSAVYIVASIGLKFILGMAMALLLNERFRGRTLMRGILFLPWAMPTLIVALAWRWIYEGSPSGLLNLILIDYLGSDMIVQWLANPKIAIWSVIIATI